MPQVPPARPNQRISVRPVTHDDLAKPPAADWLTYHGGYNGGHHSTLTQIDTRTVAGLRRAWVSDTDPPAAPAGRGGERGGRGGAWRRRRWPAVVVAAASVAPPAPAAPVPPGQTGVGRAGGRRRHDRLGPDRPRRHPVLYSRCQRLCDRRPHRPPAVALRRAQQRRPQQPRTGDRRRHDLHDGQ